MPFASAELAAGDTAAPLLAVTGLTKSHGDVRAVIDAALTLQRGEVLGLLGSNGAGKTSLMTCVAGLQRPDAGSIMIGGIDALAQPWATRALCGVMLQSTGLPARLTVMDVLRLFAALRGADDDLAALMSMVGLDAKASAPVEALSGGQRQRLGLALALIGRPPLLLLDEPGSGFDPAMRDDMQTILKRLRAAGHGIVLATHDMAEAAALCDRVVILTGGRVVAEGTPAALVAPLRAGAVAMVRTARPLAVDALAVMGAVLLSADDGDGVRLRLTVSPEAFLAVLTVHLAAQDNRLLAISIGDAGLQDVIAGLA